jgi:hypothetical protein
MPCHEHLDGMGGASFSVSIHGDVAWRSQARNEHGECPQSRGTCAQCCSSSVTRHESRETAKAGIPSKHSGIERRLPPQLTGPARACRRKFLQLFPGGFRDDDYLDLEREYKWETHIHWEETLSHAEFRQLLRAKEFTEIAARAVRVEQRARYSMIFSFEKMALRDAVRSVHGAKLFAQGLYDLLHGRAALFRRVDRWTATVAALPRKQTRVLTWPLVTVFGFIAQPDVHIFVKPKVTRAAALQYGFDLRYHSRPSWELYSRFLQFAGTIGRDLNDLHPRDMIDIQSFMWIQGSEEYGD